MGLMFHHISFRDPLLQFLTILCVCATLMRSARGSVCVCVCCSLLIFLSLRSIRMLSRQNSFMGSPIVSGRVSSPSTSGPTSLPYEVPSFGSRVRAANDSPISRSPVSKVMDMFRNRSNSVSNDDKRKVNIF